MAVKSSSFLTSTVVCVAVLLTCLTPVPTQADYFTPTPKLKKEFNDRCLDYFAKYRGLNFVENAPVGEQATKAYCVKKWQQFAQAFAFKDACTVTKEDYMPFLQEGGTSEIKDKLLFWSKHQDLSIKLSQHQGTKKAVVLADTLQGYLVTNLIWCGEPKGTGNNPDGILYGKKCPECKKLGKKQEHLEIFWAAASALFARRASGVVRHLVNGAFGKTAPNCAHHPETFFAKYELPNIPKGNKVTEFRVIVANEPGREVLEGCETGTIKTLRADIKKELGIEPKCIVNPKGVLEIFCKDMEIAKHADCASQKIQAAKPF